MKIIGTAMTDGALREAITMLFRGKYEIVCLNDRHQNHKTKSFETVDLLIIDIRALDEHIMRKIRLMKKMKYNLPVILLYDLKIPEYVKSDLFPVADVMFRKPFSNYQLLSAVEDFLGRNDTNY